MTTPSSTSITKTEQGAIVKMDGPGTPKTIMAAIAGRKKAMAAVANQYLTPEKLIKLIGVQLTRNPRLGRCTPLSVLDAAMNLAELGLAPGVLGEAYMVPFRRGKGSDATYECQLIIGYRGLMKLARRSGEISTIQADIVRKGDVFRYRMGMNPTLEHEPTADLGAEMTHAWAMATFKDGGVQFVVMRAVEVAAIRARSKSKDDGPWVTDPAEMGKKTAIRRLCKMLPLSTEASVAIQKADEIEGFDIDAFTDGAAYDETDEDKGDKPPSAEHIAGQVNKLAEEIADVEPGPEDAERKKKIKKQVDSLKTKPAEKPLPCKPGGGGPKGCEGPGSTIAGVYYCEKHHPEHPDNKP